MFATDTPTADDRKSTAWWAPDLSDNEVQSRITNAIARLKKSTIMRRQLDLQHLRMYGGAPMVGYGLAMFTKPSRMGSSAAGLNIVRSCSDALTAKLCSDEMKASLITSGADPGGWEVEQKAKGLERYLDGLADEIDEGDIIPAWVLNACVMGSGVLKGTTVGTGKNERPCIDVMPLGTVQVDELEAVYGRPPCFYERRWMDRQELLQMVEESGMKPAAKKKALESIRKCDKESDEDREQMGYQATGDQVLVTEAYRPQRRGMPVDPNARHVMTTHGGLIYVEDYEYETPPYVFYSLWPQAGTLGFWGHGIAAQLRNLQYELNVLMQKIQQSFHLLAVGHVLIDKSSKVNKAKIDNQTGSIWEYLGTAPQIIAGSPVAEQVFSHLDRIYQRAFEISGISQLEAASLKPKGLDSGKAIDSYLDVTTERFNICLRRLQKAFVRLKRLQIRLATDISSRNKNYGILSAGKSYATVVHFQKNMLEDDRYVLRIAATNKLGDSLPEQIENVERMVSGGWIDPVTARRLIDFPDTQAFQDLDQSSYDVVEKCIAKMLDFDEPEYMGPEKFMNLGTPSQPGPAIKQVLNSFVRAFTKGAPERNLRLMKKWLSDAQALMQPDPAPQVMNGLPQLGQGIGPAVPGQGAPALPAGPVGVPAGAVQGQAPPGIGAAGVAA